METPQRRVLRIRDVSKYTGLSQPTIHRYVSAGVFPKPVRLGARAVGWKIEDLDDWVNSRQVKVG